MARRAQDASGWSDMRPGTIPNLLKPGQAVLIKAGSDIVLQMHYTAAGEEQTDRVQNRSGLLERAA